MATPTSAEFIAADSTTLGALWGAAEWLAFLGLLVTRNVGLHGAKDVVLHVHQAGKPLRVRRRAPPGMGTPNDEVSIVSFDLFVNGTLMRGLPLHGNLAGADFLEATRTAPSYRLYAIADRHPGRFAVEGILYPRKLAEAHHRDISDYDDWRAYLAALDAER